MLQLVLTGILCRSLRHLYCKSQLTFWHRNTGTALNPTTNTAWTNCSHPSLWQFFHVPFMFYPDVPDVLANVLTSVPFRISCLMLKGSCPVHFILRNFAFLGIRHKNRHGQWRISRVPSPLMASHFRKHVMLNYLCRLFNFTLHWYTLKTAANLPDLICLGH